MPDLALLFLYVLVFCLIVFMLIPMLPMEPRGKAILVATAVVIAIIVLLGWIVGPQLGFLHRGRL